MKVVFTLVILAMFGSGGLAAKNSESGRRLPGGAGHFSDPELMAFHPDQYREQQLYEMMNPLYGLNALMSPFYKMYGMDPMAAVMHPYLMGNYKNPFLASGATPTAIQKPSAQFMYSAGLPFMNSPMAFGAGPQRTARKAVSDQEPPTNVRFDPIVDPGFTGNLQALKNPGIGFSNNMPASGIMNPFINTAGMMNPFLNRSGANPYYALTGATDAMIGSPFNNFGFKPTSNALLYKMSAMNPFVLGNFGIGSPFVNSGVNPNNPAAPPTNGHNDLDRI